MHSSANCKGGTEGGRGDEGMEEGSKRRWKLQWSFFLCVSCTAPSCICQQDVRCVHRCGEGASSSVTSLSLSPVTLTLGVSAQPQIPPASLPVTKTLHLSTSVLYMYSVYVVLLFVLATEIESTHRITIQKVIYWTEFSIIANPNIIMGSVDRV